MAVQKIVMNLEVQKFMLKVMTPRSRSESRDGSRSFSNITIAQWYKDREASGRSKLCDDSEFHGGSRTKMVPPGDRHRDESRFPEIVVEESK